MPNSKQGDQDVHQPTESETAVHDSPNPDAAPGQSSASDWDMNKTKPSGNSGPGREAGDAGKTKPQAQQAPQNGNR